MKETIVSPSQYLFLKQFAGFFFSSCITQANPTCDHCRKKKLPDIRPKFPFISLNCACLFHGHYLIWNSVPYLSFPRLSFAVHADQQKCDHAHVQYLYLCSPSDLQCIAQSNYFTETLFEWAHRDHMLNGQGWSQQVIHLSNLALTQHQLLTQFNWNNEWTQLSEIVGHHQLIICRGRVIIAHKLIRLSDQQRMLPKLIKLNFRKPFG